MYVVGVRSKDTDAWAAMSGHLFLFADQSSGATNWHSSATLPYKSLGAGRQPIPLPFGISSVTWPTSSTVYEGRTYYCGGFTYNLLLDEHHRLLKQGIRGPEEPPAIAGAAGSGNIAYLSWYDELTGERSPLSMGTVISNAVPRTWTLPARPPDDVFVADGSMTNNGDGHIHADSPAARTYYFRPGDRVGFPDAAANLSYLLVNEIGSAGALTTDGFGTTPAAASGVVGLPVSRCSHLELWLSVSGGLPQLVMRVALGTTTVVESVATADLGEAYIGAFERFPRCTMNVIWNDRQILAGDPDHPDTVYLSDLFQPERYSGLNFRTRTGEPATGLLALRDYCLVFTRDQTFMLQGYSETDFELTMVEQSLGSIGHLCNAVLHGAAYIWTEKGPYMYNGAWHALSPENDFTVPAIDTAMWVRGVVDPESNTYSVISDDIQVFDRYSSLLLPGDPLTGIFSNILVFDYTTVQPETGGNFTTARLSVDAQNVLDYSVDTTPGYSETIRYHHYLANKWGDGALYTISYDGTSETSFDIYPYQKLQSLLTELVPGLPATYDKGFWVKLGWNNFQDPGGSVVEAKTFRRLWVDSHAAAGALLWLGSGSDAYGTGSLALTLPASSGTPRPSDCQALKLEKMTGRGLGLIYNAPYLISGGSFRGHGGNVQ
jgi:hypothetical protein